MNNAIQHQIVDIFNIDIPEEKHLEIGFNLNTKDASVWLTQGHRSVYESKCLVENALLPWAEACREALISLINAL